MARDVLLAAVIGAQGLKGEVKAKLFTAAPDAFGRLAGTFSSVAEFGVRSTTYEISLVQVVKNQ